MNAALLLLAWLAPLVLAVTANATAGRFLTAVAALPALAAGLLVPVDTTLSLP